MWDSCFNHITGETHSRWSQTRSGFPSVPGILSLRLVSPSRRHRYHLGIHLALIRTRNMVYVSTMVAAVSMVRDAGRDIPTSPRRELLDRYGVSTSHWSTGSGSHVQHPEPQLRLFSIVSMCAPSLERLGERRGSRYRCTPVSTIRRAVSTVAKR